MSILLGGYSFDGPFEEIESLVNAAGVYAVLLWRDGKHHMVDVRESADVKRHASSPELIQLWADECGVGASIHFAVLYTPGRDEIDRQGIELRLRDQCAPSCGNWCSAKRFALDDRRRARHTKRMERNRGS